MATIAPNIVGLFFAKHLEVDVAKRELSVIGLFPNRAFPSFPTATVEMTVLSMVNGGRGEGILQLLGRTRILPGNPGEPKPC